MAGEQRWEVASATTIGSMHVREHLPNQDSVAVWATDDGTSAVAVVADGHGHHAHFRSDVGSHLAVTIAHDALRDAVRRGPDVDPVAVGSQVTSAWRSAVLEHVETHPLRSDESRRGPLVPYGSTLVAVAVTPTRLVVLQLGDGDTVLVRASGEAVQPLPDDPALDGVHTSSLCQPDPMASLRTAVVPLDGDDDPLVLAYVATDGLGKGRADARTWWRATARDLLAAAERGGVDAVRSRLPGDVAEPARIGGDDTTVAVVSRVSAGRASTTA